jgi:hypothetical protein
MKLWRLSKIEGFILKYRVPHLGPTYIGERRTTFAKAYGIKVRCYLDLFGKHVRTWELFAWAPPTPPPPQGKKREVPSFHALLIGCMEIIFLKLAATILA